MSLSLTVSLPIIPPPLNFISLSLPPSRLWCLGLPYGPSELCRYVEVVPVMQLRSLDISWPMRPFQQQYNANPARYTTHNEHIHQSTHRAPKHKHKHRHSDERASTPLILCH